MAIRVGFCIGFLFGSGASSWKSSSPARALFPADFQKGSKLVDTKEYQDFSTAKGGRTPVYLPPGLPIVLKNCDCSCGKRLSEMREAQKICESIGAKRLIIPQARSHGNFLIEDRIPFSSIDPLEQMGLYVNHKEKFTQAIRELTALFCQASLHDLKNYRYWFSSSYRDKGGIPLTAPVLRFDNLPLYIENGEGKIGLIDLEFFSSTPNDSGSHWSDLIFFFPYHAKDILDVVQSMPQSSPLTRSEFDELHRAALEMYEKAYVGHQNFLAENGIHPETASQFQIDPKKIEAIQNSLKEDLEKGLLMENPSEKEKKKMRSFIDRVTPEAAVLLQKELDSPLSKCKQPKEDLARCRSFQTDYEHTLYEYLKTQWNLLSPPREESGRPIRSEPHWIANALVRTMVKEGAIYDYVTAVNPPIIRV